MLSCKMENILKEALRKAKSFPDMRYTLHLTVGDLQFKSVAVVSYRHTEDYVNNIFDAIIVEALFTSSQFAGVMMYGHENMKATLEAEPYDGGKSITTHYRAILLNNVDQRVEGNTDLLNSMDKIESQSFATASIQLYPVAAYDMRMRQVGGIFKRSTASDILKYVISKNMLHSSYSNEASVSSITFDDDVFPKQYSQLVIPDGTKLTMVGDYLHEHYGIFNNGFGMYLKNRCWYVYAPYNVDKFKRPVDRLVIMNAPANKYRNIEENFFIEGSTVTVIATGETSMLKTSDRDALNHGTGVRFADSGNLMDHSTSDAVNEKPKVLPQDYVTEYTGVNYKNSMKNTPMIDGRFSANPAIQSSKMAASAGTIIQTKWENGNLDLVKPGMAVEFWYGKDDRAYNMRGTVLKADLVSTIPTGGFIEPRHRNVVVFSIFLKEV